MKEHCLVAEKILRRRDAYALRQKQRGHIVKGISALCAVLILVCGGMIGYPKMQEKNAAKRASALREQYPLFDIYTANCFRNSEGCARLGLSERRSSRDGLRCC